MQINRPQVLLLGNGINRTYGGTSWTDLLKKITTREDLLPYVDMQGIERLKSPMPLQAILLTDNKIDVALKTISDASFGEISNEEHRDCLRRILSMGFDHILTTNYSYEIEIASQEGTNITQSKVISMQRFLRDNGIKQAEPKYLLHTYNEVKYLDSINVLFVFLVVKKRVLFLKGIIVGVPMEKISMSLLKLTSAKLSVGK